MINKKEETAELVGIFLGDGSFFVSEKVCELDIAFNTSEKKYCKYVENLLKKIVDGRVRRKYDKQANCVHLRVAKRKNVLDLLAISYVLAGNKIKNKVTIPSWVKKNKKFLKACLRGLIDTDGSFYRLKPHWPNLVQLSFKNYNKRLLKDVRDAFILLGFHPSKIFYNQIVITRQNEISKYLKEIGTNNKKTAP